MSAAFLYSWMDGCSMREPLHTDMSGLHATAQQGAAGTRST